MPADGTIYSFVLDKDPRFTYEAWHLARSLVQHCHANPETIHLQCTPEVSEHRQTLFRELGCQVHRIERFGDGRYCNKLNQLENLLNLDFDQVVLLDTDTIVVSDLRPFLSANVIRGKIVDLARPPLATLDEIADAAGLSSRPPICTVDAADEPTYLGNCNGGFYSVPKEFCATLSLYWRSAALWLLDHIEPLRRIGREHHVDQVSFWLAIQQAKLPFEPAASNVNYYVHFSGDHRYFDATRAISLLHYHGVSFNHLGFLAPPVELNDREREAVQLANEQIAAGFDNRVFWELRYDLFPELGSGIGSRDHNLLYKRRLLQDQGIEKATSVLDVGCGDLEVVGSLHIRNYLGLDQSHQSIEIARRARPDWEFSLAPTLTAPGAEMVLCLEVLIHQKTLEAYRSLIHFLAEKTRGSLLVSGYEADSDGIRDNHMVFFHEPLETSLRQTDRFRRIQEIGRHTGVVVYRCDV